MPTEPFRDESVYGLTSADVTFLRRLARDYRHNPIGGTQNVRLGQPTEMNSSYLHGSFATAVYVVRTPFEGIPPATIVVPSGDEQLLPGVAYCQLYQFVPDVTAPVGTATAQANGTYQTVDDGLVWVDNISLDPILGNTWVLVKKEKYERWVAEVPLPGVPPFTGTGTGTGFFCCTRALFDLYTNVIINNANTIPFGTEAVLHDYILPGGLLFNNGDKIEATYIGAMTDPALVDPSAVFTVRMYFGTPQFTTLIFQDIRSLTTSSAVGRFYITFLLTRTSINTVRISLQLTFEDSVLTDIIIITVDRSADLSVPIHLMMSGKISSTQNTPSVELLHATGKLVHAA